MEPLDDIKNEIEPNLTQFLSFKNIFNVIQSHSDQTELIVINLKVKKKKAAVWESDTDSYGLGMKDRKRDRKTGLGWLIVNEFI